MSRARREGRGRGRRRLRPVLELLRGRGRARPRRPRVRGRERRERRLSARSLRGAHRDRRGRHRGCRPGRLRGDRDHRLAVRRLPPVAPRVPDRRGQLPRRRRRARERRPARRPAAGHLGPARDEVGLRGARRAAERRQVDARERAHRREGGDRLEVSRTRPVTASAASGPRTAPSSSSSTCPAGRSRSTR